MAQTALLYDEVFLAHQTGAHVENGERVTRAYETLSATPLMKRLLRLKPVKASRENLLLIHDEEYVDFLSALPPDEYAALDPDTVFGPGSLEAAYYAAGAVTAGVEAVTDGACDSAFCMIRPPGHHALRGRAMGFCIFNNIAIGAAFALKRCGHERVAIIDFDVHHGNGTQAAFYEDGRVLFVSLHQYPFYPGTGAADETGSGKGANKTLNIPLPGGSTEEAYLQALAEIVVPAACDHGPSLVLISAGFDAHAADPIGGMRLRTESFAAMTRVIRGIADECCSGRVVSVLEGGYNFDALSASILAHLEALAA